MWACSVLQYQQYWTTLLSGRPTSVQTPHVCSVAPGGKRAYVVARRCMRASSAAGSALLSAMSTSVASTSRALLTSLGFHHLPGVAHLIQVLIR